MIRREAQRRVEMERGSGEVRRGRGRNQGQGREEVSVVITRVRNV